MTTPLLLAIIAMTTALIAYSIGVWGEKRSGTIKPLHLGAFWFGLLCDTTGTELMRRIGVWTLWLIPFVSGLILANLKRG